MHRPRSLLVRGSASVVMCLVAHAALAQTKPPATSKSKPPAAPAASASPSSGGALTITPEAAAARGIAAYDAGQYDQCAEQLGALLHDAAQTAELSPRTREQAHVYRSACLIAQGNLKEADDEFRVVIRANPQMAVPSAIVFPQAVIERFVIVRTTLFEEIRRAEEERIVKDRAEAARARKAAEEERARVARLEKLAAEETLVAQNHRWLAFVPFGVGQFQNRDVFLGGVFLASETLLLGTAVTATLIELRLNSQAQGGHGFTDPAQIDQLNRNLDAANQVALYSLAGFLTVATLGIVEANLSFEPEFRLGTRPRGAKPPSPKSAVQRRLQPFAGPLPGGGAAGIGGVF